MKKRKRQRIAYESALDSIAFRRRARQRLAKESIPFSMVNIPPKYIQIESWDKMTVKNWKKAGKPTWWLRIGQGKYVHFLQMPAVNGCEQLKFGVPNGWVAPGETIYMGVGPYDIGVRDEHPQPFSKKKLIWWPFPRYDDGFGVPLHIWQTKCRRYGISRSCTMGDFSAFRANAVMSRHANFEEALFACYEDALRKSGTPAIEFECNLDEVLLNARTMNLHTVEGYVDKFSVPLGIPTPPISTASAKPKKESAAKGKGRPGVVAEIIAALREASKKKPITKEELTKRLVKKFPDRDAKALKSTASARIADMEKRRGVLVRSNGKGGYWAEKA